MANRGINVLLSLRDRFSGPMENATSNVRQMERQVRQASNVVSNYGNKANDAFKKVAKGAATAVAAIGGLAIGTGFKEAFDLEGYRLQLETATKDTKKAADIMKYAVDLANKTPFEGGELVEGAAKFEAMGMSAKKWLPLAGDMAAATNKDYDQATEALIDAQNGELERLKEFGLTKASIVEKAGKMFNGIQVVNNKGQITDQEKFNEAMTALMTDKFAGGMEKQATTVKGLWSTVTGVTKSALAKIVGMSEDGSIAAGSPLEKLKGILSTVAKVMENLQSSGKLEEASKIVGEVFTKAVDNAAKAIGFLKDNADIIIPVLSGVVSAFAAFNTITPVIAGIKQFQKVTRGLKAATGLKDVMAIFGGPVVLAAVAIGVLVAAFIIAYKKSETFRNFIDKLVIKFKEFATILKDNVIAKVKELGQWFDEKLRPKINNLKASFMNLWDNVLKPLIAWLQPIFVAGFAAGFEFISSTVSNVIEVIKGVVSGLITVFTGIIDFITGVFTGNWELAFKGIGEIFSGVFEGLKSIFGGVINFLIDGINLFTQALSWIPQKLAKVPGFQWAADFSIPKIPNFATGTNYFSGGMARINEGGRGEIVNLPNGTQIIPHDVSKKQSSQPIINVSVSVQGNVIGNEQYADYIGGVVARKVVAAYGNM